MITKTIQATVASGLLLTLTLVGCAKPVSTIPPSTTATTSTAPAITPTTSAPTAKPSGGQQGELRIALATLGLEKFNPVLGTATTTGTTLAPAMDWAFWIDKMGGDLVPGIVEKWVLAPDGLSWNFSVRHNVKFHNGSTLTADDLKFTFDQYLRKDAYFANIRDMVDRAEKIDDYTVRIYTKGPQPYLPNMMTLGSPAQGLIMPKAYVEQNGWDYFERHPMGSGPFKFSKWVGGDFVQYEALGSHWQRTPDFKTLTLISMPEETTRVASIKTGAVDLVDVGIEFATQLEKENYKTFTVDAMTPMVQFHGAYDPRAAGKPITDVRVRQALTIAIDSEEIRKDFFYGKAGTPVAPYVSDANVDLDVAYWKKYAASIYKYDPEGAKKLLKEAGYPDGFSIKLFTFAAPGAPYLPKLAEIVQNYWSKIGVKAEMNPIEFANYTGWRKGPADPLVGQATTYRYMTSFTLTPNHLRTNFHSTGSTTLFGKAFPEMDKLMDGMMSETNAAKRKEMIAQVVKATFDSYTVVMLGSAPSMAAMGPRVSIDFATPLPAPYLPTYSAYLVHRK